MSVRVIAIGPTTQNDTAVSGQSMMFQLVVNELKHRNIKSIIVDIGKSSFKSGKNKTSGEFNIVRVIDYILILFRLFFILIVNFKQTVYLTTAQSKVGFIRDYFIINLARLFGSKVVIHQFGANYKGFYSSQSPFFQNLIKQTLSKTDVIVVEGDYTKHQFSFLDGYESKVCSIPNGLPEKIVSGKVEAKSIDYEKTINLLYLSNLIESKGYWDVLKAINLLVNTNKLKIRAVFSGKFVNSLDDEEYLDSTEAKAAFFNYVKEHNLENSVIYYNGLYGSDKSAELKLAHFFLLPSYYINEGQPVSIVEALAFGCVPIVTEYRLIPMMVDQHNGVFVKPKAPEEIAEAVNELAASNDKYNLYSKACIEKYLNNFTSERFTEKLINLF